MLINESWRWSETGLPRSPMPGRAVAVGALRAAHRRRRGRGRISLQNLDRKHAFSEADLRLLTTLAASLSVALESARLFDETKRLLTETERRAAELAIVNSVQRGLAAELDVQAMYELVGERASDVFDTQVVDIAIYDPRTELMSSRSRSSAARATRSRRGRSWASASTSSRPGNHSSSPTTSGRSGPRWASQPSWSASPPCRRSSRRSSWEKRHLASSRFRTSIGSTRSTNVTCRSSLPLPRA